MTDQAGIRKGRGGRRPGAGRPVRHGSVRTSIHLAKWAYLELTSSGSTIGETVEELLLRRRADQQTGGRLLPENKTDFE